MIAKKIQRRVLSRPAKLVKYMLKAQGNIDPNSWKRTADYILDSGKAREKVSSYRVTNCGTDDPAQATMVIEATQAMNKTSKADKTFHLVFSFPGGERPDISVIHAIEDELVDSIRYTEHQRISAVHDDTQHLHVHVAINKVHPTGFQNVDCYRDEYKLMFACDQLEKKYGLVRTNHSFKEKQQKQNSRAVDKETYSGEVSLISVLQNEVFSEIKEATSWDSLHTILHKYDLTVKKRGAGLVIGSENEKVWVKASSVSRDFSINALEKKLGTFKVYSRVEREKTEESDPKSWKRTVQIHNSSKALFAQYQAEKQAVLAIRKIKFSEVRDLRVKEYERIKSWSSEQRMIIKASKMRGFDRRRLYGRVTLQAAEARKKNVEHISELQKQVSENNPLFTWNEWLVRRANSGDTEALSVLRSRQEREEKMHSDLLTAKDAKRAKTVILKYLRAQTKRDGTVWYRTLDGGVVLDRASHVQAKEATTGAALVALKLAAEKFEGQALEIRGTEEFKKNVATLAGLHDINVRFENEEMESIRLSNIAEKESNMSSQKKGEEELNSKDEELDMSKEFDELVAKKLVQQIKTDVAPWQEARETGELKLPFNAQTGKKYEGVNMLWLKMQGYKDPRWMTAKQAGTIGAKVRTGEKGTKIEFWKKENGELKSAYAFLFNADQVDGLSRLERKAPVSSAERYARAEKILKNSGARIEHQSGNLACYRKKSDVIVLPPLEQFSSKDDYYAAAFKQLSTWTGKEGRLDRDISNPVGTTGHAKEELRSEIAKLYIADELDLNYGKSQAGNTDNLVQILQTNPRELFQAVKEAQKIRDFVMGFEEEQRQPQQVVSASAESDQKKMTRLVLPFAEKEEAKSIAKKESINLRWDRDAKSWFVAGDVDVAKTGLAKWLPKDIPSQSPKAVSPEVAFADSIRAAGLKLEGVPEMDGKMHRVAVEGDKNWEKSGSYVGFLNSKTPAGYIQNWKTGEKINWKFSGKTESISTEDRIRMQKEAFESTKQRDLETKQKQEEISHIAQTLWDESIPATADHPYCRAKGISSLNNIKVVPDKVSNKAAASGIRVGKSVSEVKALREKEPTARVLMAGDLLIPLQDENNKVWSLQTVNPYFKGFMRGGRKSGLFTVAGASPSEFEKMLKSNESTSVVIAEGYATANTVSKLINQPVVVAFDCGNLSAVASRFREKWPDKLLLIAADNDHQAATNIGLEKAKAAAKQYGGGVLVPEFAKNEKGTDWNDYAKQHGEEASRKELQHKVGEAKVESAKNINRLKYLANEREAKAVDDPTTNLDNRFVSQEREKVSEVRARAVSEANKVASLDSHEALDKENTTLRQKVEEQRRITHSGHNVSSDSPGSGERKREEEKKQEKRRYYKGIDL